MYYFFFLSRHLLCSLTFLVLQWFFCRWDYLRIIPVIYIAIYLCGHLDFLFHTKIPFWGRDFNLGWFFLFWFFIWMRFFYLNEIFYLDEILLSERDFSFWMRFSYLNEIFYSDEILLSEWDFSSWWNLLFGVRLISEPFLFHTKIPFGVRFVGGFWETDAPSFIRSHHGSSPFYSVFLYQPPR